MSDYNTDKHGRPFPEELAHLVWRQSFGDVYSHGDVCGARMELSAYGKTTPYGWHIDHIQPKAENGTDDMSNLRPLHWANNKAKGNTYLAPWKSAVPPGGDSPDFMWTWLKPV